MTKMKRCNFCGASQDEVRTGGTPPKSTSATPTYTVKQTTPTAIGPPGYMGGQAVGRSPTQGQSNIGVNHAAPKRRLRPIHAIIIGAAIALAFLIFVDELKLRSDVEIAGGRPSGQVIEVDLARGSGVHQLEARVNSAVDVQFLLDSGASDVTLPEEVVKELLSRGALSRSDFLGEGEYTLANGDVMTAARFMLRSISIGDLTVSNVVGSTSPPGSPALLGQSFLQKFTSWNVDNTRNKLVLQPPK